MTGKGQFECGSQHCTAKQRLRTWEVNFGYVEHGEKRNALVKIRTSLKNRLFIDELVASSYIYSECIYDINCSGY